MLRSSRALRGSLGVIASVSASSLAFASPSIFINANETGAIAVVSSAACKVPLPNYGVAGKYALALYITIAWKNALELVEAELQQVCGAAETNLVFADFHKYPSVSKTVRVKAIVEISKNIKFNDVMKNFLAVLAENGKLSQLPQIISTYTTSVGSSRKSFSCGNCSSCNNTSPTLDPVLVII
ncbi:unnamed protein product [Sphagnum balticum]